MNGKKRKNGTKLHFSCMSRTQSTKNNFFFNWLHFFFSWLFLYHEEVTRVFSSTLNFAAVTIFSTKSRNRRRAILPQTQICKFGRTKFDTNTVLSGDEVLVSLIILLQVLLSSWRGARKVRLCLLRDLAFHLQNCRIQQKLHEMYQICLWLERMRSSHKEFSYLLYNSTENTMKLTKFGILVNKTTSLFTTIRDSKISRGVCENFGNSGGEGGGG